MLRDRRIFKGFLKGGWLSIRSASLNKLVQFQFLHFHTFSNYQTLTLLHFHILSNYYTFTLSLIHTIALPYFHSKNLPKICTFAKIYQYLQKVVHICQKLPTFAKSCQNLPKVATICQKLPKSAKRYQKLPKGTKSLHNV